MSKKIFHILAYTSFIVCADDEEDAKDDLKFLPR